MKHLDELVAANKQLEIELAKKKERLPPEEEAIMLLKQVSDLGVRLGLDIKLWKPGAPDRRCVEAFRQDAGQRGSGRGLSHGRTVFRSNQSTPSDYYGLGSEDGISKD